MPSQRAIVRFVSQKKLSGANRRVFDQASIDGSDFGREVGSVVARVDDQKRRVIAVGTGKSATARDMQQAAHAAAVYLRSTKTKAAVVEVPDVKLAPAVASFPLNDAAKSPVPLERLLSEWMTKSAYSFDELKTGPKVKAPSLSFIDTRATPCLKGAVEQGRIIGSATNFARRLGNLRPDHCDPAFIANEARKLCGKGGFRVRHDLDDKELERRGLHLLRAVGTGSTRKPRLVVLEYEGNKKSNETFALVGKGVTMDTGGLNVKAFGSMETMHMDMMGAAAVLGTAKAIQELKLPVNVVVALALVENAIGNTSYLPSTIIKSLKGTTVEITNTDAEGRLILADAMTFVQDFARVRDVTHMIDVATLTGACVAALGEERAGLFTNDAKMGSMLCGAGEEVLEPVWPLPIDKDHEAKMKGTLSDLINCTSNRYAGACTAAAFLKHFVNDDVKWAHLDIAGPGLGTAATKFRPAGAPGYGVSLLVRYLEKASGKV